MNGTKDRNDILSCRISYAQKCYKKGDERPFNDIYLEHNFMINKIINMAKNIQTGGLRWYYKLEKEYESELNSCLASAILTYKEEKGQFNTYAYHLLKNGLANVNNKYLTDRRRIIFDVISYEGLQEAHDVDWLAYKNKNLIEECLTEEISDQDERNYKISCIKKMVYSSMPSKTKITMLMFLDGVDANTIAKKMGLSVQHINSIKSNFCRGLKKQIEICKELEATNNLLEICKNYKIAPKTLTSYYIRYCTITGTIPNNTILDQAEKLQTDYELKSSL